MIEWLKTRRRRHTLRRHAIPDTVWREAVAAQPLLESLPRDEADRARELATLLLVEKDFIGAGDHQLTAAESVRIAALAALPVLALGIEWYRGWYSVIVYPGHFAARHQYGDSTGLVHEVEQVLSGEAWERGPVVLSVADVTGDAVLDGYNVVLHEFAHKLDMLNGDANGMPPLHRGMSRPAWTAAFSAAFDAMNAELDAGHEPALDPYAAEAPGEFFAVMTEAFFEIPELLAATYPDVHQQLRLFYRQDPAARLAAWGKRNTARLI